MVFTSRRRVVPALPVRPHRIDFMVSPAEICIQIFVSCPFSPSTHLSCSRGGIPVAGMSEPYICSEIGHRATNRTPDNHCQTERNFATRRDQTCHSCPAGG